jgi:hypothetical protein
MSVAKERAGTAWGAGLLLGPKPPVDLFLHPTHRHIELETRQTNERGEYQRAYTIEEDPRLLTRNSL